MRIRRFLALIPAILLIAGCSAVGKIPIEVDRKAKEMQPPDGKALVYVVRPANTGRVVKMPVYCDGVPIGSTGGQRYIYTVATPGSHLFVSEAENTSELTMSLEAGKTYYLEQKIKMGLFKARNNLEQLSDAEGREKLMKCDLSTEMIAVAP